MRWPKSSSRAQLIALRHLRKLQEEHRNACYRDGQKPLRDRVIKFVLLMCAYPLNDRAANRMPRQPIHNKRTI